MHKALIEASTYKERAVFEMSQGKINAAIDSFTRAIEKDLNDEECFILRSKCYQIRQKTSQALDDANWALTLNTRNWRAIVAKVWKKMNVL